MLKTTRDIQKKIKEGLSGKWGLGRGLYLRISKEGAPFFMYRHQLNGIRKEYILGRFGVLADEISLSKAQDRAAEYRAKLNKGEDLKKPSKSGSTKITINDVAEIYIKKKKRRVKSIDSTIRVYKNDISPSIGSLSPSSVSGEHIQLLLDNIVENNRPTVANDALLICKELLNEAVKYGHVKYNIALVFTEKDAGGKEHSRTRTLSFEELEVFYKTIALHPTEITRENFLAFALLNTLLVRKGELIAAKWVEFDLEKREWTLDEERTKTSSKLIIPLPFQCVNWLEELKIRAGNSEYVFPARLASKRREYISDDTLNHALSGCFNKKEMKKGKRLEKEGILAVIGFEHFVVHDLRRTGRTLLADLGVDPFVAERCLNHKLKGVLGIYDRHDYYDKRKIALQKLADKIAPLVNI